MVADEPTLSRLMVAAQGGDKAAANVLLTEVGVWLERYFSRRVPHHQIDDLVQEVLTAFYTKRATWDPARPFLPWLAAIARYRWVDHLRKVYKHDSKELMEDDAVEDSEEELVMARVSLDRLFGLIPEKQAEVIELVKIAGLSIREAAEKTGQSESLVKVNIHRGLKKLATLVEKAD
ncbi:sigma-70 family RNA polymerase sigma factor [Erythrobacter sp. JK5]|uniref:sigma-70 family RNA polymerase sigma factor n=1 Tax=Erythrobacter sp. JK5 TaxID=2829500 RepID=UPI001BA7B1C0|nr:sigma-70 family RNA polymerase sigma factor [Erythrobacter sp. JK5]QUL37768.1 sigma-70 family RNA polymerase sigma factor [Erythrobacter sp. JK5]